MTYMKMGQVSPTGEIIYSESVVRLSDLATIPFDEKNKDYAEYLDWLAKGNTPLEFDFELLQGKE
jgi:hypothetical protein